MDLDDIDIHILCSFWNAALEQKETTTWLIAKGYQWKDKKRDFTPSQEHRFYTIKNKQISNRIKKMAKEEIIRIDTESEEKVFTLLNDVNIFRKRYKFPSGIKDAFLIKRKDERWMLIEI